MRKMLANFWSDECGAVSPEWMLMATVMVLGSVAVLAAAKVSLYGSVADMAKAVGGM